MVTACKNHITDGDKNRVWDQERSGLITKMEQCLRLNAEYQASYQRTKRKSAEHKSGRPFEFSEMYIFGKFDTFCRRLNKVLYYFLHIGL